ncbi:carbonic anhydrase family protein [Cesiribacter sp. SM1]|uniref:carbonic anhydrase family protein n=1 Tax=Cesiribacter sp. SM1 TaxID=2861196 RepID=UPI001CD4D6E6|nr:carbonic anhydrase family protein [Cesiribacter sp. SM1]
MKKAYVLCLAVLSCACGQFESQKGTITGFSDHTLHQGTHTVANTHLGQHHYLSPEVGHGEMQSPINIISGEAHDTRHNIALKYRQSKEVMKNLGHTVQLVYDEGSYIQIDQQQFDLQQFHFHTPSEHLVDGITYPLEMHLVHVFYEEGSKAQNPQYLVVGLLFKAGKENPFLSQFMENLPQEEGQTIVLADKFIDVNNLIKDNFGSFYHYIGSLTTHPYTESVNWLVLKHVFEASAEQIEKLNRLEGNNARHIQALNNREVEEVWH